MSTPWPSPADPLHTAGVGADGRATQADPFHTGVHHPLHPDSRAHYAHQGDPLEPEPSVVVAIPAAGVWSALLSRPVRYPDAYCWYVLVCALDLMLTNTVIHHAGAIEVNALAARAIEFAGFWGLIALKVCTMIVVLLSCELIGEACVRKGHPKDTGKRLAEWAVVISSIPVVLTLLQLGVVAAAHLILT